MSVRIETKLVNMGGKRWEGGPHRRIYLPLALSGLKISRYGTGNISSASLDGEKISNAKARELDSLKIYWNCESEEVVVAGRARLAAEIHERLDILVTNLAHSPGPVGEPGPIREVAEFLYRERQALQSQEDLDDAQARAEAGERLFPRQMEETVREAIRLCAAKDANCRESAGAHERWQRAANILLAHADVMGDWAWMPIMNLMPEGEE